MEQAKNPDQSNTTVNVIRERIRGLGSRETITAWSLQSKYTCVDIAFQALSALRPTELPSVVDGLLEAFAPLDVEEGRTDNRTEPTVAEAHVYKFLTRLTSEASTYSSDLDQMRGVYFAAKRRDSPSSS